MFQLMLENHAGEKFTLTQRESDYQIVSVEGLNPPNANLIISDIAGMDGGKLNFSKLESRNIVLTVRINGEVEENRLALYRFAKSKRYLKIYYRNRSRNVFAEGYIESIEGSLFAVSQTIQISIVCPDPYFYGVKYIVSDISYSIGEFEFPFTHGGRGVYASTITDDAIEFSTFAEDRISNVYNEGEADTGMTMVITARGTVVNPLIYNYDTQEFFKLKLTMNEGDIIHVDTRRGRKSITQKIGVVEHNLIGKLGKGSTWLSLGSGDNRFRYDADSGAIFLTVTFEYHRKYQGV